MHRGDASATGTRPAARRGRAAAAAATAAVALAVTLGACGGGDDGGAKSASEKAGEAAVAARQIPQGVKITHTETGSADVATGSDMIPLKTFSAAKRECGYWHAWYVGKVYGPGLNPNLTPTYLDAVAHSFAVHRAAPGDLTDVQHGCRAGLHA
jgi:hypothetical protein